MCGFLLTRKLKVVKVLSGFDVSYIYMYVHNDKDRWNVYHRYDNGEIIYFFKRNIFTMIYDYTFDNFAWILLKL